jgi:hypothetical protein
MPGVRLLFPVDIVIEPVDKAGTDYDPITREPILQVARAESVTISAQAAPIETDRLEVTDEGPEYVSSGYFVILVDDCTSRSYTPRVGDKITASGGLAVRYFVISVTPHAHKFGRNQTWHLNYESRDPTKRRAS